ncbi:MAG: class I SAM-dependent methyltransferase [Candidatus Obscuribacterales bacterium]|nr:class I SAM-dependent methyltransferase [Candidatus Obscuribacterales bacterium]
MAKLTKEEYAYSFGEYLKVSESPKVTSEFLRTRLTAFLSTRKSVKILSIGTGTGALDFAWTNQFNNHGLKEFSYTMLEPNPEFQAKLKNHLASHPDKDKFELIESALETADLTEKYDCILVSHVFYYLKDRLESLKKIFSLLEKNGVAIIIQYTPSGVYQIHKKFLARLKGNDYEAFSCEDLVDLCDTLEKPYSYGLLRSTVNMTDCFEPDSKSGRAVLEFMVESKLDDLQLLNEVRRFAYDLTFEHQSNRLLYHPVGLVIIGSYETLT